MSVPKVSIPKHVKSSAHLVTASVGSATGAAACILLGVSPVVGAAPQPDAPVEVAADSMIDVLLSSAGPSGSGLIGAVGRPAAEGAIPDLLTGSGAPHPVAFATDDLLAGGPFGGGVESAGDATLGAGSRTESLLRSSAAPTIALATVGGFLLAAGYAAGAPSRARRSRTPGPGRSSTRTGVTGHLPGGPSVAPDPGLSVDIGAPVDAPAPTDSAAPTDTSSVRTNRTETEPWIDEPEIEIFPVADIRTGHAGPPPNGPEAVEDEPDAGATTEWSLPAIAAIGYRELAAALAAAHRDPATVDDLATIGVAYVRFALTRPGLFQVMFGVGCDPSGSDRLNAVAAIQAYLAAIVGRAVPSADPESTATGMWALIHGLAFLYLDGKLDAPAADAVAERVRAVVTATLGGRRG